MDDIRISDELLDLVSQAVEESLETMRLRLEFKPFLLLITKEGRVLQRFLSYDASQALEQAHQAVAGIGRDVRAYAIAYDGVLTVDEADRDAILIEAGERDQPNAWVFAQFYAAPSGDLPPYALGKISLIHRDLQRLT